MLKSLWNWYFRKPEMSFWNIIFKIEAVVRVGWVTTFFEADCCEVVFLSLLGVFRLGYCFDSICLFASNLALSGVWFRSAGDCALKEF